MKKTLFKKCIACLLLILVIAAGFALPASAYSSQGSKLFSLLASEGGSLQGYIDNVLSKNVGTPDGDWLFIDLMRHDGSLNGNKYAAALDAYTSANALTKPTDYERIAIAYTAAGIYNDFVGSALEAELKNNTINALFFELILLDCGGYESAKNKRDGLIDEILGSQMSDNGWTLSGPSDVDMTAMALQALAPYKSRSNVASAVERALGFLSGKQTDNGDFRGFRNTLSCESTAQVIIALTSLGIDPASDSRFIKKGATAYDGLRRYQLPDGSYCHVKEIAKRDNIATEQAARAIVAAERFSSGKSSFFSFEKPAAAEPDPPSVVTPDHDSSDDNRDSSGNQEASQPGESTPEGGSGNGSDGTESDSAVSSDEASSGESTGDSSFYSSSEYSSESIIGSVSSGSDPSDTTGNVSYKFYACGAIAVLFIAACIFLVIKKKASLKNIVPIAVIASALICGVIFLNFTSVKDYYSVNLGSASEGDNTATISISCRILEGVEENIPEDGYILKPTTYVINEGDTVFDALLAVTRANQIKINYTGNAGGVLSVYVSSIAGFSEMQYGALSGWIYRVNKYTPDVGCGSYDIKDGDVIEWVYTLDLGKDAENG